MQEFENIVETGYSVGLCVLLLLLMGRFIYYYKTRTKRIPVSREKKWFRLFRYAVLLILPIFLYGVITFVFVIQKANMFVATWRKNSFLLLTALILITEIIYNIRIVPKLLNRILNLTFVLAIAFVGIYLVNLFVQASKYPDVEKSAIVSLPFEGTWIATGAGATGLTNHHDKIPSQKYAVDISRVGSNGKLFTGAGVGKEESNTYGADVLSPVTGVVAHVVDTLPDHPVRERDKLAGNQIVIRFRDTFFVAMAHLQPRSIPVKIGDNVSVGQKIGKVGLSGNTDICHLHIHVQDGPIYNIETSRTYPIRFKEFSRKRFAFWSKESDQYLLTNDIVRK